MNVAADECTSLGVHTNPLIPKHVLARAILLGQILSKIRKIDAYVAERVEEERASRPPTLR